MPVKELRSVWECVSEVGYFFEFENADNSKVTIRVIAQNEDAAYRELEKILE